MGITVSLLLVAAGAILAFAVDATVSGVDIVAFWASWGGFGGARRDTTVIERDVERDRVV